MREQLEVRRGLWSSFHPTLPPQHSQLEPFSTRSRELLNISTVGDSTTSLGNLSQCSITLTVKKCPLMFRGILPWFRLCPLPPALPLGSTEQSLALSSLHPPCRYLYLLMREQPCLETTFVFVLKTQIKLISVELARIVFLRQNNSCKIIYITCNTIKFITAIRFS